MTKQWADELTAFTRAFAGAAIFGIPLVFTMEMWWIGKSLPLLHLVLILLIGFLANFGLSHVSGFRKDHSFLMSLDQAVDAVAVGIVSTTVMLFCLNQLRLSDGIAQNIGVIMLLSVPLGLGASVALQLFGDRGRQDGEDSSVLSSGQGVLADVGATAIGSVFIGMSIAPTDEIKMIAAGLTWWHTFLVIGLTLFLSYLIVFASGFDEASPPGPFQHPVTETLLAYVISLVIALVMLMVFERVTPADPLPEIVRQTVTLALPASIGGAAGRLVV